MEFKKLETQKELESIQSNKGYSLIFKHNTSCPISMATKGSFEKQAHLLPDNTAIYVLDLLNYREISNGIAENFGIEHQSPQLLLIKDGKCILDQALYDISAKDAASLISSR